MEIFPSVSNRNFFVLFKTSYMAIILNTMKYILFALFTILWVSFGIWENPIKIEGASSNYSHGMFIEERSSSTYIFFGKNIIESSNIFPYLCYKKYSPENKLIKENCILQERIVEDVKAAGNEDKIFVIFNARRKKGGEGCNVVSLDGCHDVYFTESSDGGKTWSESIPIPRNRPSSMDWYERVQPRLLLIKETGRLFVTYYIHFGEDNYLYFSTRPEGSTIFQNEKEICHDHSEKYHNFQILYKKKKKGPQVLIFFQFNNTLRYILTENNGIKWEDRRNRGLSSTGIYSIGVSEDQERIFLYTVDERNHYLGWSDYGYDWMGWEVPGRNPNPEFNPIAVGMPENKDKVLYTSPGSKNTAFTYVYDVHEWGPDNLHQPPPINEYLGAVTFKYITHYYIRVLAVAGKEVEMHTYIFSESQQIASFFVFWRKPKNYYWKLKVSSPQDEGKIQQIDIRKKIVDSSILTENIFNIIGNSFQQNYFYIMQPLHQLPSFEINNIYNQMQILNQFIE